MNTELQSQATLTLVPQKTPAPSGNQEVEVIAMSTPNKRSAADLWKAICEMVDEDDYLEEEDEAADREAERILALSPEDLRRELVEAGLNPDEVHAAAERFMASLSGLAPEPTASPVPAGEAAAPTHAIGFASSTAFGAESS